MFHRTLYRGILRFKMNFIVKVLILSDVIFWGADGLLAPVFAIFVTQDIVHGNVQAVGVAAALYLIVKSVMEIFVGWKIDQNPGERDDLYTAFWGTIGMGAMMFLYTLAGEIWHVYLLQVGLGISAALAYPGWVTIFTRHVDRERSGFEWSFYDVSIGIAMAVAAVIGATLVDRFGFDTLFVIVGTMNVLSSLVLLTIRDKVSTKETPKQ